MNTLIQKIFLILTSSPENLVYHLVLAFAVMAAFQTALIFQRKGASSQSRRMVLGLVIILLGQLALFLASALTWQGLANPQIFLPPLDRAVITLSIIWSIWLWAFSKPSRLADAVTAILSLLVLIFFGITLVLWSRQPIAAGFNTSILDTGWNILSAFLVLIGLLILIFQRGPAWGVGASFLLLHLAGFLTHLIWAKVSGDYSAPIRLGMLCAYPLLPSLVQNLLAESKPAPAVIPIPVPEVKEMVLEVPEKRVERRRYTADPRSAYTWLQLAAEDESSHVPYAMARAIAQSMVADLCILVSSPPHGMINLESGYDLIQEEELAPAALRQDDMPALTDALQRGETLIVTNNPEAPDPGIEQLGQTLGLDQPGNLMLVPVTGENIQASGILLMSPYSNRQWNADDQTYLVGLSGIISRVLQKTLKKPAPTKAPSGLQEELEITLSSLAAMQLEIDESRVQVTALKQELEKSQKDAAAYKAELDANTNRQIELEQQLAENEASRAALEKALEENHAHLAVLQEEHNKLIREKKEIQTGESAEVKSLREESEQIKASYEQLKIENEKLRHDLESAKAESPELDAQFRMTLEETARLKNSLAEANSRIAEMESQIQGPAPLSAGDQKEIINLEQELRQPLASIMGYSELLLSEKTGILGALQHRLMLRVKQSTKRMETLLDDINAIINRSGERRTSVVAVDFNAIVDKTIAKVGNALRDKDISLNFDLPEDIPSVHVDEDSMEQVVFYLMQNAILATPKEGDIHLHVNIEYEADQPHFLIQVTDSGGGIAMEDLPRVFSRTYLEDHPEIAGLGDQGVGLSIAKTLTEAHHGRIWVESEPDVSSTFSVLFPFRLDEEMTVK